MRIKISRHATKDKRFAACHVVTVATFGEHHTMTLVHSKVVTLVLPAGLTQLWTQYLLCQTRPSCLANCINTTYDLKLLVLMVKKEMPLLTATVRHVSSPTSPVQPLGNHRLSNTSIPLPLQLLSPSLALYHTRIQTHIATHVNQERTLSRAARGIHVTLSLARNSNSLIYRKSIYFGHCMRLLSLFLKSCFSFSHCIGVT